MIRDKSILAIIPARGGSKGLPRKNILPLAGKPLIAWTIHAAEKSKYIDRYVLSTDDEEIANIAQSYNCEVPFLRPKELSRDETPSFDVVAHAIDFFKKEHKKYDYLILLEPTSPLRDSNDIDSALENLLSNRDIADSIVGVSKIESTHPVFNVKVNDLGLIEPYTGKKFEIVRRQEIDSIYFKEGSVYISDVEIFLKTKNFYHERTLPYIVPRWKSIEIDEIIDLLFAETIINNLPLIKKNKYE